VEVDIDQIGARCQDGLLMTSTRFREQHGLGNRVRLINSTVLGCSSQDLQQDRADCSRVQWQSSRRRVRSFKQYVRIEAGSARTMPTACACRPEQLIGAFFSQRRPGPGHRPIARLARAHICPAITGELVFEAGTAHSCARSARAAGFGFMEHDCRNVVAWPVTFAKKR